MARERGWGHVMREHFDAQLGSEGALLIGEPEQVVETILPQSASRGGIAQITSKRWHMPDDDIELPFTTVHRSAVDEEPATSLESLSPPAPPRADPG